MNIVESILNNPLDMPMTEDPRMTALTKKLQVENVGIQKSVDIMNRVAKQESEARAKINEQLQPKITTTTASVDYELIKTIVESVIDKRIGELKQTLNESRTNTSTNTYIPSMKFMSFKDNFFFVDNDDNVFECTMKYKGKNAKKS